MKNVNQKKKIVKFSNFKTLIGVVVAALMIQSCCTINEGSVASCRIQKPKDYVFNESKLRPSVAEPANETSAEALSGISKLAAVEEEKFITNTATLPVMPKAGKKLPLGLQSISTNILAGPNLSMKRSSEDYGNLNHKSIPGIGYHVGVGLVLGFGKKLAVEPSLLVKHNTASEKLSYSNTGGEPGPSTTDKYSYTYLSVPVHASIKASENLSILVGPELNYLLGAKVKYDGGNKQSLTKNSIKLGLGLQAGLRLMLPKKSGPSGMGLQLLYDHRLSRLNEKSNSYTGGGSSSEAPAWRMSSFSLGFIANLCEFF
jgi:Outer membrane protein beta-barrel domain